MARIETSTVVVLDDGTRVSLSPADIYAVGYMLGINNHVAPVAVVTAIKYVRLQHSLGLKEAKDVVDALRDNRSVFD